ncbi:MAG: glycosyltransferase, partial [Alphaproteobacteria bacterium]|nr:glycosyltransferase [Alphaproteobacteria bacterium]
MKNAEGDPDTTAEIIIQNKIDFEPKVSVIIPVYNVEEYLRECLDSVVNQTLKEIEIICVDDGSTDSSLEILKEYASKDNRITVMKQENLHAGIARNAGLAVAKGEYLSFLDSDDFFELNMLEEMYKNCKKNKIDVCICDVQFYDNATKKTIFPEWTLRKHFIPQKNVFNCFDIAENIFHITNNWPWNKMFSKHFIKQLNLCFQNTSHTNDTYFVCVALINGKNITVMKDKFVHYRTNVKNSLTSSFSRNKAPDNINRVLSAIYKKIKNNKIFYRSFVNLCCEHLTWNLRNITDKESSEILKSKIIENNFYDIPSDLSSDYFYSDKIYNEYLSILDILPGKVIDRNLIISQLENFEYISFDIFDTILLRPFSN